MKRWTTKLRWTLVILFVFCGLKPVNAQETVADQGEEVESVSESLSVDNLEQGRLLLESINESLEDRQVLLEQLDRALLREEAKRELLSADQPPIVAGSADSSASRLLAQSVTKSALLSAHVELLHSEMGADKALVNEVEAQLEVLRAAEHESRIREEREVRARTAERDAESRVEEALAREAAERDLSMRQLFQREREMAELVLALTRESNENLSRLTDMEDADAEAYAEAKGRILIELDEVTGMPDTPARIRRADPLFLDVLKLRRSTRESLLTAFRERRESQSFLGEAEQRLESAAESLANEKIRETEGGSELIRQRIAVARAELDLRTKEVAVGIEESAFWQDRIMTTNQRARFLSATIQELLGFVSGDARDALFGFRNETFRDASISFEIAVERVLNWGRLRSSQFVELGFSVDIFTWLLSLATRIFIFLLIVFLSLKWLSVVFHWIYGRLLKQRTLRRWPGKVATLLEFAYAVFRPYIIYRAAIYPLTLVTETFPEVSYAQTVIEWVFLYLAINAGTRVVFLPRSIRQFEYKQGLGLSLADNVAWFIFDLERARKFVQSARVLALFWLLATLIPAFFREFLGITLLTYVLERSAFLILLVIVYWVIAKWRNEIAALFTELAGPKLPRAVTIVNDHKDRFYGVLVVGLATLYIIVAELSRLGRQYLVDTEWYSTIANFWFRKRIELQNREERADVKDWTEQDVPKEYRELFASFELPKPEDTIVREGDLRSLENQFDLWKKGGVQGSVAIAAEVGMGRSCLVSEFEGRVEEFEVSRFPFSDKAKCESDTHRVIAELLGLEWHKESSTEELVEAILKVPSRVLILDDCHNMYIRKIGGFEGLDTLLQIVTLTDHHHFWVLTFNIFAWDYVNRVRSRQHMFGKVWRMDPWSQKEIQTLIETRHAGSGYELSFSEMVVDAELNGQEAYLDVVKTSQGFYKYLHEFSGGNPRLAMLYWLRSLRLREEKTLEVRLFKRPKTADVEAMDDSHWFVLTAIAQHGQLNASEIAEITNLDLSFCALALNYFQGRGVTIPLPNGRMRLAPLYFRQVIRYLKNSNFLYS